MSIVAVIAVAASCKTYSEEDKQSFEQKMERFISRKHWSMERTDSGLYVEQLTEGTGEEAVIFGSEVTLAYKGTLLNGTVFDRKTAKDPLKSELKGLIMAFQEGLLGQKKGAKLRLVVPPQLGYGDMELDKIPQNSVLIFEVELLEVH